MGKKISIVVTTYNGEKYIEELLESLRKQTMQADEVLILDDCSKDNTIDIVKEYVEKNSMHNCIIIENKVNQGWKKNFFDGFKLAQGQYIFPCDQDDIWDADKLKTMVDVMDERKDILLLVSNYNIFFSESDNGSKVYERQNKLMKNDGSIKMISMDIKWPYIIRPGCTFCFRKSFFDELAEEWNTKFAHDAILWRYACVMGGLAIINKPLIRFRRHGDNTTSNVEQTKELRIETLEQYLWFHDNVKKYVTSESQKKTLEECSEFLRLRIRFFKTNKVFLWGVLWFKYRKYYLTYKGCLADLYYRIRG